MKQIFLIGIFFHFYLMAEAQNSRNNHHHHPYAGIVFQRLNSCKEMPAYQKVNKPSHHREHKNTESTARYSNTAQPHYVAPANKNTQADNVNNANTSNTSSPVTASPTAPVIAEQKKEPTTPKDSVTQPTSPIEVTKKPFEALPKPTTEKPLELPPINFVFNQDELAVANMESFIQAVEYAQNGYLVLIEGHTDDKGDNDYNLKLSMKRVQRIKQLMIDMGVNEETISVVGHGETQPIVSNDSEANRLVNRRIEFKVFKIN